MKRTRVIAGVVFMLMILLSLAIIPASCDFARPQQSFRMAVPKTEFYSNMASNLKPFLERKGYKITILPADNAMMATRLAAEGAADLAMINNHSMTIALELGENASQLRTLMPLTTRLLYVFTRNHLPDSTRARIVFENKRIGVERIGGETHMTLVRFMSAARISGVEFTPFEDNPDVVMFWGPYYDERAEQWTAQGWHPYSFNKNWIEFITLNDPALREFLLPAVPGDKNSIRTTTLATDVMLVANRDLGENACYLLVQAIFQNKMELVHMDIMYKTINESFNSETLLFPIHNGTFSYLLRDQTTFFERYADSLALGLSILAVFYGIVQAIQSRLRRGRKERIDKYFLEFLEIRSDKAIARDERVKKLDDLFQRAVVQLTNEKLEKGDFHILSRLIQQDLTMLRFNN